MQRKIGAYIRVSTEEQAQVFEGSLDSQQYLLKQFVEGKNKEQRGWGKIVEFYIDDGYSAATTNRPAFQQMLQDLRKKRIELIVVTDLSRLSRNIADFCGLLEELKGMDANFISMRQSFLDTSTPGGRMMVHMMVTMGQFEREQTAERVSINCHSRAMRGYLNGGKAVLGYKRDPLKPGTLIVDEDEAKIVRLIFKTFLIEGNRAKTIRRLHEMGIYPKQRLKTQNVQAGLRWNVQSLGNLLSQWSYIGYREVNKQNKNIVQDALKPWEKYSVVKASWSAIIDEKTFQEAQRMLNEAGEMDRARLAIAEERVFLVSGLMTCGHCGRALVGSASHSGSGDIYRYYKHSRASHAHPCAQPRIRADELENSLFKSVGTALKTAGYFANLEKRLNAAAKAQTPEVESEAKRVSKCLSEIEERIAGIMQFQRTGKLVPEALELISEELNGLAKEKLAARSYLDQISSQTTLPAEIPSQTLFVKERMQDLMKGWHKAPVSTKKRLLKRLIKSIVVTNTEVAITFWLTSETQGTPIRGSKNVIRFQEKSPKNEDQNSLGNFAPLVKNGSERRT